MSDQELTPPVTVGPVTAATYHDVPFVTFADKISHYSGAKLAQFIMDAIDRAGAAISIDEDET